MKLLLIALAVIIVCTVFLGGFLLLDAVQRLRRSERPDDAWLLSGTR